MDVASSTLTPLRFLQRSEDVWAERPAVRDGARAWTYAEHGERVRRAAGALRDEIGIADGRSCRDPAAQRRRRRSSCTMRSPARAACSSR